MMNKGMSLFEIIITLLIFAICLSLAIPTFSTTIANYRLKSAIILLENDLRFAKQTANSIKKRVSLCTSTDQKSCSLQPIKDWQHGWLLFIDSDNNFQPTAENILRYRPALRHSIQIISSQNIQHGIQFNSGRKFGRGLGTGLANGYFIICYPNQNSHKIILNIYGRLRHEKINNDC